MNRSCQRSREIPWNRNKDHFEHPPFHIYIYIPIIIYIYIPYRETTWRAGKRGWELVRTAVLRTSLKKSPGSQRVRLSATDLHAQDASLLAWPTCKLLLASVLIASKTGIMSPTAVHKAIKTTLREASGKRDAGQRQCVSCIIRHDGPGDNPMTSPFNAELTWSANLCGTNKPLVWRRISANLSGTWAEPSRPRTLSSELRWFSVCSNVCFGKHGGSGMTWYDLASLSI